MCSPSPSTAETPIPQGADLWVPVAGRPMYARVWPAPATDAGLPIVLVHGLGVSSRYMVPTAARLAHRHAVFAPDLPGHGRSAHPPHALNVSEQAAALGAWLAAARLSRVVLLGNSLGCQVIAELVEREPGRVAAAVLNAPTMDPQAPTVWQEGVRLLRDTLREPPALWWVASSDYLRAGPLRMVQTLEAAIRDPLIQHLPALRCPTLVVGGERDVIVPPTWAREVARRLPLGRLAILPGTPHAANFSRPAALVAVTEQFLGALPAA